MNAPPRPSGRVWLGLALAITAAKLWLTAAQPVYALGWAAHDDLLFLQLAEHLVRGEWLGPYTQMTLAKGPFYSLWAAGVYALGVPLFVSQQALYAAACALFVLALRPGLRAPAACFALYALLLWNPMSFEASSLGRVLRQHVYVPLGLLVFAGLAALYFRREFPWRRQLPWAALAGLAFGAFHLTREETVWIIPGVALLTGAVLLAALRTSRSHAGRSASLLAGALVCALLPVLLVSALNLRHYGWFGTVEFRAGAFKDAYGALVRIQSGPDVSSTPVTREAREAAYAVSPTFARLQPFLEGNLGRGWAEASTGVTGRPAEELQIGGGWFMWALRDAVQAAGQGRSAHEALAFYRTMADEINAACDDGRLPAGPLRRSFLPLWKDGYTQAVARTFFTFGNFVVRFRHFSAVAPPSDGDASTLNLFRRLTGGRLSNPPGQAELEASALDRTRVQVLHRIGKALRPVLFGLFVLAQGFALALVGRAVRRREWTYPLTLAAVAWGSGAAYLLIQAVVHVTSFPVLVISSFASAYPCVLLFIGASFWGAGVAWRPQGEQLALRVRTAFAGPVVVAEPNPPDAAWKRWLPWAAAPVALAPYLFWQTQFAELFWFADDLFLIDQLSHVGFGAWILAFFTESFVPLFKLLWGGMLLLFDGSYAAMIRVLWLTHALNTVLLGRLLLRAGFPWFAAAFVQVVFALAPANLETLGWSVQWSAMLAVTCLLLALVWHECNPVADGRWRARAHLPLVLLAAAGACCFARGVLTGGVLAFALLLPIVVTRDWTSWRPRLVPAGLCLLPALAVATGIVFFAEGNQRDMTGHWGDAMQFGLTYFVFNPGHLLLGEPAPGSLASLLLGGGKLAVLGLGLRLSQGRSRLLLLALLAYDLGNATLLGIGRHDSGTLGALGPRYYYSSLLSTLPFAGLLLSKMLDRWAPAGRWRTALAVMTLALLAGACLRGWPRPLADFVAWRGTEMRQAMQAPYDPSPDATVPALGFMHLERAKALQRAYGLH